MTAAAVCQMCAATLSVRCGCAVCGGTVNVCGECGWRAHPDHKRPPVPKSRFLTLLPETTAAELQANNPLVRASPTLVADFKKCPRYAYFRHRCGVRAAQNEYQKRGDDLDQQWTRYSRDGVTPTHPLAHAVLVHLPPPKTRGVHAQRAFQFASPVLSPDTAEPITWFGYMDLFDGRAEDPAQGHVVSDHKSVSNLKSRAKAPHEMPLDVQMVVYATATNEDHLRERQKCPRCWAKGKRWDHDSKKEVTCEDCAGTGFLTPLVDLGVVPSDKVTGRWLYTETKNKTKAKVLPVAYAFTRAELAGHYAKVNEDLRAVANTWRISRWQDVSPNWDACVSESRMHTCDFRRFCDDNEVQSHAGNDAVMVERHLIEAMMSVQTPPPPPPPDAHPVHSMIANYQPPPGAPPAPPPPPPAPPPRPVGAVGVMPPDAPAGAAPVAASQLTLVQGGASATVDALNARVASQRPAPPASPAVPPPPPPGAPVKVADPWGGAPPPVGTSEMWTHKETTLDMWGRPCPARLTLHYVHGALTDVGGYAWHDVAQPPVHVSGVPSEEQACKALMALLQPYVAPPAPPAAPPAPPAAPPAPPAAPPAAGPLVVIMEDGTQVEGLATAIPGEDMLQGSVPSPNGSGHIVRKATTVEGLRQVLRVAWTRAKAGLGSPPAAEVLWKGDDVAVTAAAAPPPATSTPAPAPAEPAPPAKSKGSRKKGDKATPVETATETPHTEPGPFTNPEEHVAETPVVGTVNAQVNRLTAEVAELLSDLQKATGIHLGIKKTRSMDVTGITAEGAVVHTPGKLRTVTLVVQFTKD